jgi:PKD domain
LGALALAVVACALSLGASAAAASPSALSGRYAPPRGAARSPITLGHSGAHGAIYLHGGMPARLIKSDCSSACVGPLFYRGGPVMSTPKAYAIYWNPSGAGTSFPSGYETTIDTFMEGVEQSSASPLSSVFSVDLLYGDELVGGQYGWAYGGSYVDTASLPARDSTHCPNATASEEQAEKEGKFGLPPVGEPCVTDAQLRTQIEDVIKEHSNLPIGLNALYFIMTPETVNSCAGGEGKAAECTTNSYCAYHWDISSPEVIYANMPYADRPGCETPDQPNHNPADDEINVISHEGNEAITDPLGGEESEEDVGWLAYSGNEVADLCTYPFFEDEIDINEELDSYGTLLGGTPKYSEVGGKIVHSLSPGAAFNQELNGGHYLLQREWSDAAGGCIAHAPRPSASIAANSSPAVVGQPVSFDGAGSSAGAGALVSYEWEFGDGSKATGSTLTRTQHTYASVGVYTVTLRVTNDSGASAGTTQQIVVSLVPTTTSTTTTTTTTVTTAEPVAHYSVAEVASLLGLPHSGARLSGAGQISIGHATCPVACGVKVRLFALVHAGMRVKRTQIGSLTATIARKGTAAISLSLNGRGQRMLRKGHPLATLLIVAVEDSAGASWTIERRLTLTSGGIAARHSHAARRRR